jgi:hypothetical protein
MRVFKEHHSDGTYYFNERDELHREDGPAVEWASGDKSWFINGKRHRIDGPAVEYSNGYKIWFINDQYLTEEEFNKRITKLYKILYG